MEINKKIRELAEDPDIDIGIKHLSVADVKRMKVLVEEDGDIESNIKLLNGNDVQRRKQPNGVVVAKSKKAEEIGPVKGKFAKVIKGGAKN